MVEAAPARTARVGEPLAAPEGEEDQHATEVVRYARSPRDLLRLAVLLPVAVVLVAAAVWAQGEVLAVEEDLLQVLDRLPDVGGRLTTGVVQLLSAAAVLAGVVVPLVQRRLRAFGYVLAASLGALVVVSLVEAAVGRADPRLVAEALTVRAGLPSDAFPDTRGVAQIVAVFTVLGPFVSRRWRRAGWALVGLVVLLQLALSAHLPVTMFAAVAVGAVVGAAVLLAFGRPDQRPTTSAVAQGLRSAGLDPVALEPAGRGGRGSTRYAVTTTAGTPVVAKVVGADERSADLLFRAYRWLRLRNVGDERPFSSLRRTVEHEALVALLARDVGVRTPRLRAAASVGEDAMVLGYDFVTGTPLDRWEQELPDEVLDDAWQQLALLRGHGVAHRDLRRGNLLVDGEQRVWVVGFGFSEVAARPQLLDQDVAQLLASTALLVGAERSVAPAVRALGPDTVARALPRLQLTVLSAPTRTAYRHRKDLFADLQRTVADRTGVEEVQFEDLQRVSWKTLLTVAMLAAVTYFLLPQLADLPGIVEQVRTARWGWVVPLVGATVLTFVGATVAVTGSVPDRLRILPTFVAQVASSFASKLAPSVVGGMALNLRFLQKSGVAPPVAVSGVGLNTVAGFVVHVALIALFFVWAGRSAFESIDLPNPERLLWGVAAVAVLAMVSLAVPWVRRLLADKLWPVLRRAGGGIAEVARRPAKLALLVGGSVLVTAGYVIAIYVATRAFGADLSIAQVGAVYLVASTLATAAPTPGGLGALEAALIAGLTAAGLAGAVAVPAVFLYRLATFWVPILPGWLAFRWLRGNDFL